MLSTSHAFVCQQSITPCFSREDSWRYNFSNRNATAGKYKCTSVKMPQARMSEAQMEEKTPRDSDKINQFQLKKLAPSTLRRPQPGLVRDPSRSSLKPEDRQWPQTRIMIRNCNLNRPQRHGGRSVRVHTDKLEQRNTSPCCGP